MCRGAGFWQNVHSKKRAMRKSKERIQRSTSRLSTLFLKWSRKEKKSRDERRHESVMDRERVKEETASRGDRERDRERQEREREGEGGRGRETERHERQRQERKKREKKRNFVVENVVETAG